MSPSPFAPRQLWSTALPALCRASPPPIQTCVTLSSILRRFLLSPLLSKACVPDPSSFPPGRAIVSIVITVEEGQSPNPPGPFQHSRSPATYQTYGSTLRSRIGSPLKQDISHESPPPVYSFHAAPIRGRKTPRTRYIRPPRRAINQAPPSPRRPPIQSTPGPAS